MSMKNNYSCDYEKRALAYNQAHANSLALEARGDFQGTRLALMRGIVDGGSTGACIGLFPAIYYRSLMPLARYSAAAGVSYAAFLGIASLYRFDI